MQSIRVSGFLDIGPHCIRSQVLIDDREDLADRLLPTHGK